MKTSEGEIFKQESTRYLDRSGKRVTADTPGAMKVVVASKKWYGRVKNPATGKWKLIPLSKDKQAARSMLDKKITQLARGEAGLVDPFEESKKAPISVHIQAYIDSLGERGRSRLYRGQTEREIKKVLAGCGAERLSDLTADKVDRFLKNLACSARSKNGYRQSILGLCNFLVAKDKLSHNPLAKTTRSKGEVKRKRRALPAPLLQLLLEAARQRPLLEAMTIRRGPRKGQLAAQVGDELRESLERVGRHRALLYYTAVQTGLRMGTLRQVKVGYLNLDSPVPRMDLPGSIMKSRRDFKLRLRDDLVAELKTWLCETGKKSDDLLFNIPRFSQASKMLKKDLKKAGIPYIDAQGRYFDFHSFRKCTGSFLRQAKVDPKLSMQYLDHSDIRMTMEVYNDEDLLHSTEALDAMPRLTLT